MFSTQLVILSQHFNLSSYRNTSTLELTLRPALPYLPFFGALDSLSNSPSRSCCIAPSLIVEF
ncbi:hypothetical protein O5D80_001384 [Batrachochytrium dendrobatidis]|nr:hypothetical protein O5D80_001384 [Batrachochytrium dendrobatidis]